MVLWRVWVRVLSSFHSLCRYWFSRVASIFFKSCYPLGDAYRLLSGHCPFSFCHFGGLFASIAPGCTMKIYQLKPPSGMKDLCTAFHWRAGYIQNHMDLTGMRVKHCNSQSVQGEAFYHLLQMENKLQEVLIRKKSCSMDNIEDEWRNLELQETGFMELNSYRFLVIYKPFNSHA